MSTSAKTVAAMTYLALISQDAKETQKEELIFKAEEAKHSVEVAILETRKSIFQKKGELAKLQRAVPYSLRAEVDLVNTIKGLEDGLAMAEKIRKERF